MVCNECPDNIKIPNVDARGNRKEHNSKLKETVENTPYSLTYEEYMLEKEQNLRLMRFKGDEAVKSFPPNYKRIQIQELVDIYNLDEVARLSPSQCLRALWEFANHKEYTEIFEEFIGLKERVNELYAELKSTRISLKWTPKK